ncbi:SDR family oxidoreductase [Leisingera sp. F5]|uniref:SDR family NAD(P)-dependent oxidoreductase n=1 Tax=Leisingera sp. F5 TaxID=1813816 RepID=UPI000B0ACFD5|nr:SDR family NAD(P)-dependent oxidoreductase [Leisingera sp. F5]
MAGPLCIITGVGDATGSATVRKFISQGYKVAMIARNADRLQALADQHPGAQAYACDISDLQAFETCLTRIEAEMGVPRVLVHNAVSHSFGRFRELDPLEIERNFWVAEYGNPPCAAKNFSSLRRIRSFSTKWADSVNSLQPRVQLLRSVKAVVHC